MKMVHEFHEKHGFTGSAKPSNDFAAQVPGFKRGGKIGTSKMDSHTMHEKNCGSMKEDEHGFQIFKGDKS